jgi:hypothetical protein
MENLVVAFLDEGVEATLCKGVPRTEVMRIGAGPYIHAATRTERLGGAIGDVNDG